MSLISCPGCGHQLHEQAAVCDRCGRPLAALQPASPQPAQSLSAPSAAAALPGDDAQVASASDLLPLFPVATHKFIVMSICTLGFYEVYWCYQNWKRLRAASGENLSPFWRAVFAGLWNFSLFRRVRVAAVHAGVPVDWSSGLLATLYLVASMTWQLPDPWWLVSCTSLVLMLPVQQTAQRINARHATPSTEEPNDQYSTANVVTIIVGGLLFVAAVVGMFIAD